MLTWVVARVGVGPTPTWQPPTSVCKSTPTRLRVTSVWGGQAPNDMRCTRNAYEKSTPYRLQ